MEHLRSPASVAAVLDGGLNGDRRRISSARLILLNCRRSPHARGKPRTPRRGARSLCKPSKKRGVLRLDLACKINKGRATNGRPYTEIANRSHKMSTFTNDFHVILVYRFQPDYAHKFHPRFCRGDQWSPAEKRTYFTHNRPVRTRHKSLPCAKGGLKQRHSRQTVHAR